jgi:predicted alpha/beta hydrolase
VSPPLPTAAQDLRLHAADGFALAATLYRGGGPDWLVVGSATAVPRGFYRRFAEHLQAAGVNVLTLDYRGIGGSAPRRLRGFMPDYLDWGRLDLAAAVAYAAERGPTGLVGHSYGGHAIGLLPEPSQLRAAYLCAVGAGWHGWMPAAERRRVWLLWNALGPVATRVLGYQPMKLLGIGENLPVSVYRQWKRWCHLPRYFFDDPALPHLHGAFARVTLPMVAANALDDDWALPASREAFVGTGYRNAPVTRVDLDPATLGTGPIGHMGYFRPAVGAVLWPRMLGWFRQQGLAQPQPGGLARAA